VPKKPIDLTGRKFGILTVIHCDLPPRKRILAKCECGKEIKTSSYDLLNGRTSSCGGTLCSTRAQNLIGKTFGFLTVKKIALSKNDRGEVLWLCDCICGNITEVKSYYLTKGLVKSCGCKKEELKAEKFRKPTKDVALTTLYTRYKNGAKNRKLSFEIGKDDFEKIILKPCFYCGLTKSNLLKMQTVFEYREFEYNGIDRVDNLVGYTMDNCVPCCKICNLAKRNLSVEQYFSWINSLVEFRSNMKSSYEVESEIDGTVYKGYYEVSSGKYKTIKVSYCGKIITTALRYSDSAQLAEALLRELVLKSLGYGK